MTEYTAIDGDIADFIEVQLALSTTFIVSELRRYLIREGHSPDAVHAALEHWWGTYFSSAAEGTRLTPAGLKFVERLNKRS